MPVFEPLRKRAHVCLVGSGDGHLRERGLGLGPRDGKQQQGGAAQGRGGGIGSLKAARDEYSFVNTCALYFVKRGFPYVSVLEGVSPLKEEKCAIWRILVLTLMLMLILLYDYEYC